MSHRPRRAYPQAQYEISPSPQGAAIPPAAPMAPGVAGGYQASPQLQQPFIPAQAQQQQQQPAYFAPGQTAMQAQQPVDQLTQGVAGMGFQQPQAGQQPQAQMPAYGGAMYGQAAPLQQQQQQPTAAYGGAAVAGGNYGAGSPVTPYDTAALPLNMLYPCDLLKDLPPPIHDLNLPPPPLVVPPGTTVTPAPTANDATDYLRSTLNAVPNNSSLLKKSKLPFALVFRPYNFLRDEDEAVAVVEDTVISRCRRCRAYINPLCQFVENGRRWRCNLCNLQNDVPRDFDFDQITKANADRMQRKELNHAVVEFIAPPAYLVRTPQPLIYVFAIDVSTRAMQNGLLGTVTRTILETLDRIPNKDGRSKVAFIGVDQSLHYFAIPPDAKEGEEEQETSLLVVSDVDDVFLPSPDQLLVNLNDSRNNIEKLLNNFTSFFANSVNDGFALGPALKSAQKLMQSVGGKIIVFGASLPNIGEGKLVPRDEESVFNKPKESSLLLPNNSFYKSFAVECNKSQVTVDMFLSSSSYQDVATLANLPHYTAGQTHFYPAWTASRAEDVNKLSKEISNHLSMDIELEAVMRIRGSSGLRMSSFYGNFFNRSSDLCSFPTFPRDQSYLIEVSIDEQLMKPVASIQAAVLHTTAYGQRRIRVVTIAIPVVKDLKHIYASADQLAIANYYTHKAIETVMNSSFNDAREYMKKVLVDIFTVFKKELVGGNSGSASPLQLSTNLRMLPLLLHALSKNVAFRSGKVPSDHRANAINMLGSLPLPQLIQYIYPTVFSLHDMADECGYPEEIADEDSEEGSGDRVRLGEIVLPDPINSSSEVLQRYGLYLINNGSELFLWVGGDSVPQLVQDLFGLEDFLQIPCGKSELPELDNDFNIRVRNIIDKVRQSKDSIIYKTLYIVRGQRSQEPNMGMADPMARELMALRVWALSELVEDGVQGLPSYKEFLTRLREKVYS